MIVTVATSVAVAITSAVHSRRALRHAVQGCRRLAPLLASEPNLESLSYFPYLLSWDLAQAVQQSRQDFHVAVFLDTFEDVARGEERRFERLINRLVWLMPNVLFVVSTRNRLDWGDASAEGHLDFAGSARWPGLVAGAAGEPSQHLVGYLSLADADKFLRERLRRGDEPTIPEAVRSTIARESEGYPLYLDLAVMHYMQLAGTGVEPRPNDFSGGFPELVTRVLRDLPPDERRLIRILSLLDAFDARLAAAIGGLPSEAAAIRLTHRAFVDFDEAVPLPYSIHRLLREHIRASDTGPDAFTAADWRQYAARSYDELGARFAEAGPAGDRPLLISVLNQALRLGDEFDLPVGWTADAAYAYIQDSLWEDSLRPLVRLPPLTAAAALAQALSAITGRQADRRRTATILTDLLESGLLVGDARDLAAYYAAESFREIGQGERSESLLASLLSSDSRIADIAAKGMVHRLRRSGRFTEALELIRSRPPSGMWIQMTGTLYWSQGMLDEAKSAYVASRDRFLADGRPGNAAEVSGCLAFVCGLSAVRGDDADLVAAAATVLQQSRNTWARLMARLGAALLAARADAGTASQLAVIEADGRATGLTSIEAYARFCGCLNTALSGDDTRLLAARAALTAMGSDDFRWLAEVVDFWLGADAPRESQGAASDWLGGRDAACDRWRQIIADRRHDLTDTGVTPGK